MTRAGAPTPPTKDYLAEMKRCSKCRKLKDKSEFARMGSGLQYWCKKCHLKKIRAYRQKEKEERLAEEKMEKIRQAILRKEILNAPAYKYENEYTTFLIEPIHRRGVADVQFKAQIVNNSNEDEAMGIEMPEIRTEWLKDWLNVKLKKGKE